jgi:BolA protein
MRSPKQLTACIQERLEEAFKPQQLRIVDDSQQHRGHRYNTGKAYFTLHIQSDCLNALPRVKAHQSIYALLDDLMKNDIHALSIKLIAR